MLMVTGTNSLNGMGKMESLMRDIRLKSYFFEFVDPKFKDSIIKLAQDFEDFLMNLEDKDLTNEDYRKEYAKIEDYLKKIYDLVLPKMI